MPKEDFVREYMTVRADSFKSSTILSAWKSSGYLQIKTALRVFLIPQRPLTFLRPSRSTPFAPPFCLRMETPIPTVRTSPSIISPPSSITPISVASSTPNSTPTTPCPRAIPFTIPALRHTRSTPSDTENKTPNTAKRSRVAKMSREYVYGLEEENQYLRAHCGLAGAQIMILKGKLNRKAAKKNGKAKLNVEARSLTSDEGLRLAEEHAQMVADKETEKGRKEKEREEKEGREQQLRMTQAPMSIFRGALSAKNKPQLKDIAYALNISMEGTSKDILTRIAELFNTQQHLRDDPRFVGLFSKRPRASNTSAQLPAESSLADISDFSNNASAGPSNIADVYSHFDLRGVVYQHYPPILPSLFDNVVPLEAGPSDGTSFYDYSYNPDMYSYQYN
ncbi:hypothetical protein DFH09DRAFT_1406723 [Mycena vulgaris]|nr:hypothetical protein DFH09DRAFT_1406723 [Mycena vulgaris]